VIRNRSLLKEIPGLGEKTFEQCAGFFKIPESENELDNTWVHPENYALASEILPIVKSGREPKAEERAVLKEKYEVGDITLNDIISELRKPNRDPREDLPPPILQENVLNFEDLRPGMKVKGKVKNVVDFGAFVDIGIKESALIHVSEMAERFVKNPMEVLKVGDVKDFTVISIDPVRRRIGLSLRANPKLETAQAELGARNGSSKDHTEKRQRSDKRAAQPSREDDGMTYNPFADLLRKK
jgi:uncharacterized protein